jgi:hypothetical protein
MPSLSHLLDTLEFSFRAWELGICSEVRWDGLDRQSIGQGLIWRFSCLVDFEGRGGIEGLETDVREGVERLQLVGSPMLILQLLSRWSE